MLDPQMAFFMQQAQGFRPMGGGLAPQLHTGFEGLPFFQRHPMLGMLGQSLLTNVMGGQGMMPMGLHEMNAADIYRHRQFHAAQHQVMQQGAQLHREQYIASRRGWATANGHAWTPDMQRRAEVEAGAASAVAMGGAMTGNAAIADAAAAIGGSPAGNFALMGQQVAQMGRYRIDPVTGRLGMSADSAAAMSAGLAGVAGTDAVSGMRAGHLGGAAQALHQMGLLGGPGGAARDRAFDVLGGFSPDQLKGIAGRQGVDVSGGMGKLTASDIDKLALDPSVADRIRSLDVNKTMRVIKEYSGAMVAMKEIFAEMGRPGTGAIEQVIGLQALTGGAMGKVDAKALGQMARQNYNIARAAGFTPDEFAMVAQHNAGLGQQLGLTNAGIFGTQAAANQLAFSANYQSAATAWGASSKDKIVQLRGNMEVSGAASNVANQAGMLIRLAESVGGFEKGSQAAAMVDAMNSGQKTFVDPATGKVRSIADVGSSELKAILAQTKGSKGENLFLDDRSISSMLNQRDVNAEYSHKANLGHLAADAQAKEIEQFMGKRLGNTVAGLARGIGSDMSAETGAGVAAKALAALHGLDAKTQQDPKLRQAALADILEKELRAAGAGTNLDGMSADERKAFLNRAANEMVGGADRAVKGYAGMSYEDYVRVNDPQTKRNADRTMLAEGEAAKNQLAMNGVIPQGGMLSRGADYVKAGMPGGLGGLFSAMFGGVDASKVGDAANSRVGAMADKKRQYEAEMARVQALPDGPEKTAAMKHLDAMRSELGGAMADMQGVADTAAAAQQKAAGDAQQGSGGGLGGLFSTVADMGQRLFGRMDGAGEKTPQPKPADNTPQAKVQITGTLKVDLQGKKGQIDAHTGGLPSANAAV